MVSRLALIPVTYCMIDRTVQQWMDINKKLMGHIPCRNSQLNLLFSYDVLIIEMKLLD